MPFTPPARAAKDMGTLLLHEFRPAMDAALRNGTGPVHSLADIAAFNEAHADQCLRCGQTCIKEALALPRPMLTPEYIQSRETARKAFGVLEAALDKVFQP